MKYLHPLRDIGSDGWFFFKKNFSGCDHYSKCYNWNGFKKNIWVGLSSQISGVKMVWELLLAKPKDGKSQFLEEQNMKAQCLCVEMKKDLPLA